MNYYLAVDNKSEANVPWAYFKFVDHTRFISIPSTNSSKLYDIFGLITGEYDTAKLDMRIIRNACIMYMRRHDEAYCINILKRVKRDSYELIERIYPDGISDIDEDVKGWDWITDYYFNEDNTFII